MGVIRVVSAALLGVTAWAFTASVGHAADSEGGTSFGFGVTPTTVQPGGRITLEAQDCPRAVRVSSGVFDTVTIPKGHRSATARVDWDARAGAMYQITFQCGEETGVTDLAVGGTRPNRSTASHAPASHAPSSHTPASHAPAAHAPASHPAASAPERDRNAEAPGTYVLQDGGQNAQAGSRGTGQGNGRANSHEDGGQSGQGNEEHGDGHEHDGQDPHVLALSPDGPQPPQHGVRAGAGGTLDGFDRQEFGVGAALVVATFGAAYHFAHRRPDKAPDA